MTQQEKNIKLAEWAGFKKKYKTLNLWGYPDDHDIKVPLPNFFLDPAACEKYLISKLIGRGLFEIHQTPLGYICRIITSRYTKYDAVDKSMSSALCEAIGKAFQLWK